ncbi:GMC oxidoreductase-domain-containing protein [Hyaloraphidium curvatum]|nr:GMC oxidoreductase-domain-containing protein [Hyaloraphidium curvatum]
MISTREALEALRPDFIVCGGGTAGCIVAGRLSERLPGKSVLVIEAGGDSKGVAAIDRPDMLRDAKNYHDWGFRSTPQPELRGHRMPIERGKVLGGTSCIMWLGAIRGNRADWDEIASRGVQGWDYDGAMLESFKRFERFEGDPDAADPGFHGNAGPMAVTTVPPSPLADLFRASCRSLGVGLGQGGRCDQGCAVSDKANKPSDYNGRRQTAGGPGQMFVDPTDGVRSANTARGYIHPHIGKRPNLHVMLDAHICRVLLDRTSSRPRATGLEVLFKGHEIVIPAACEVIVCAGALQSPQLLMLSGIGPRAHLAEHGIDCAVDLPVGNNLGDHLGVMMAWKQAREGAFAPGTGLEMAFWSGQAYADRMERGLPEGASYAPNMQTYPMTSNFEYLLQTRQKDNLLLAPLAPLAPGDAFDPAAHAAQGLLTNPPPSLPPYVAFPLFINKVRSRGTVRLAGRNPLLLPLVDPGYYTAREDLDDMVQGMRQLRAIVAQMRERDPAVGEEIADEALLAEAMRAVGTKDRAGALDSDAYLEEYARRCSGTVWHVCGTCRLGDVVDSRARVMGVDGLRVADASLIDPVAGNLMSAVCAVGERAAQLMCEDYGAAY